MEKVNIAIIGGGAFSHTHIEGALASHNVNLVCVCEKDEEKAQALREQYKIKVINDMEEIFADPTIAGVTLPLPDQVHCEVSVKAMRAGKHVLCEKPMSLKLDECKEMIKVSKETGKFLMVGQICRFTPAFVRTKELIEAGEIGELFFAESEYAHDYSKLGASWRFDPKSPRHGLIGGGCHAVDLLRWLCGNPIQVFGYSNRKVLKDWPTDDAVIAVMDMPNDVKAKIFCSIGCKRRYTMRTVLYGTQGTIICDNASNSISIFKNSINNDGVEDYLAKPSKEIEIKLPIAVSDHNFAAEVTDFANCILTNTAPKLSGAEGASTVSVCTAIIESCEKNVPVTVDYGF